MLTGAILQAKGSISRGMRSPPNEFHASFITRLNCAAFEVSSRLKTPTPVEAPASRVVASIVLAGDVGLAFLSLSSSWAVSFPRLPKGAQRESLFGSKHQECRDGRARARRQDHPRIGHAVHRRSHSAPGTRRRRVRHHRPRRGRNRAQDVDFYRRRRGRVGNNWGHNEDQYSRHARFQHVRPRGQDGVARGGRGDCRGRWRSRSRHPARMELLRRVQDAATDRGESHGSRPRQRRARSRIAHQRVWTRRDSDRAAHRQRKEFDGRGRPGAHEGLHLRVGRER